ncbi:MAG: hypothetical protein EOO77_29175 [Oxalobacteraceae bacterium]|nr:MAG: hypothetical protein EOO77_29175 [Oxalobacteraceae bacterium]
MFPSGLYLTDLCPYFVAQSFDSQTIKFYPWASENVQGYWVRLTDGLYFSNPDDAFAFKMRWG